FTGDIQIRRYTNGRLIDEKPLTDAISGTQPWATITGQDEAFEGSFTRIAITPLDSRYDYAIIVQGLALAGSNAAHVDSPLRQWQANKPLMKTSRAFDAVRTVIASVPPSAPVLNQLEDARQKFEWVTFGDAESGAAIPVNDVDFDVIRQAIDSIVAADF